jgi:predicted nucleic acid-binding Zn ribbon protein
MPTYTLRCHGCGEKDELLLYLDEYEKTKKEGFECPRCRSKDAEPELGPIEVRTTRKAG